MPMRDSRIPRAAARWALLLSAGLLAAIAACEREQQADPPRERQAAPAAAVRVAEVRRDTLRETVRGVGTLQASETVEIKPELDGLVTAIHVKEGQAVEAGQLLISIDDEQLQRQVAAGKAALRAATVRRDDAQREFRRIEGLFQRQIETQDARDQAEASYLALDAEVARMEAELELLEVKLGDCRIVAPFDGVISEHAVDPGDYVRAGDYLATLHRISQMEVAFSVPERYMGRVEVGQPVAVKVTAFPRREFAGEVYFVSPQIDESTRDFLVKAWIDNPAAVLKPGAFGTAVVTVGVHEQVPVVPEKALVATRVGYIVFVVNDQKAGRREVQTGLRAPGEVEIRSGLVPGEQVIVEGQLSVSDGVPVRVVGTEVVQGEPATQPIAAETETRP